MLLVGCSVGTTEYVRIIPTANQSVPEAFARATDLISQWIEFEPLDNCTDNAGNYLYRYRIQSSLSREYRGITVSVMADFKNDLLIIGYGHLETRDAMTPETRELFDSIMARLRKKSSAQSKSFPWTCRQRGQVICRYYNIDSSTEALQSSHAGSLLSKNDA
jgi:hypothetical protein